MATENLAVVLNKLNDYEKKREDWLLFVPVNYFRLI